MKYGLIISAALAGLTACGSQMASYAEMSEAEQERFMASYQKDMEKVHSLANKAGHMSVTYKADAATDTIEAKMTLNMDLPGSAGDQMSRQFADMMLESDCTSWVYKDFIDAGITYKMHMVDAKGRTILRQALSPEACAKFRNA